MWCKLVPAAHMCLIGVLYGKWNACFLHTSVFSQHLIKQVESWFSQRHYWKQWTVNPSISIPGAIKYLHWIFPWIPPPFLGGGVFTTLPESWVICVCHFGHKCGKSVWTCTLEYYTNQLTSLCLSKLLKIALWTPCSSGTISKLKARPGEIGYWQKNDSAS